MATDESNEQRVASTIVGDWQHPAETARPSDHSMNQNMDNHAVCPLCVRVVTKSNREELEQVVFDHNDARHDGKDVARLVGPAQEDLNEFIDCVRDEFDRDTFEEISQHIVKQDPWEVLD
jgi:hypothetical protein